MSNLSRLRHRSSRSARRAAKNIRDNNGAESRTVKKIVKPKTFLEYSLIDADLLFMMDTVDIFKDRLYHSATAIRLELFPNITIRVDKIGLIYSKKKKMFMILGLNDNATCSVLYKDKDVYRLPNLYKIDIEYLSTGPKMDISENANRLLNSVYDKIVDLTSNPVMIYKTRELFSL